MRFSRRIVFPLALALAACEPEVSPPPRAPRAPGTADTSLAMVERMHAQEAAPAVAAPSQDEQLQLAQADAHARGEDAKRAAGEADRKACAASRSQRLARAREVVTHAAAWVRTVGTHQRWIDGHCKLVSTSKDVAVVTREAGRLVVRPHVEGRPDALSCSAPRPVGLSEDDARDYLLGALDQRVDEVDGPAKCEAEDAAAGLVGLSATFRDVEGLRRILHATN